jgi:hypothetical protein
MIKVKDIYMEGWTSGYCKSGLTAKQLQNAMQKDWEKSWSWQVESKKIRGVEKFVTMCYWILGAIAATTLVSLTYFFIIKVIC